MTIYYETTASASRSSRFLRACWNSFQAWREREAARAILHAMDDRELKDLGLTRSEIEFVLQDTSGKRIRADRKI